MDDGVSNELKNKEDQKNEKELISSSITEKTPNNKHRLFISSKVKKNNVWTKDEDDRLLSYVSNLQGKNWKETAKFIKTKSSCQCSARYKRIRPGIVKGPWSKEDDEEIKQLVALHGKNWTIISKYFSSRNGKQIRDRYLNYLDVTFKKKKFSPEEDKLLLDMYLSNGPKWSLIAANFDRRSGEMVKNRFYSFIRKRIHKNDIKPKKKVTKNYYKLKQDKIRLKMKSSANNLNTTLKTSDETKVKESIKLSSNDNISFNSLCNINNLKGIFDINDPNLNNKVSSNNLIFKSKIYL